MLIKAFQGWHRDDVLQFILFAALIVTPHGSQNAFQQLSETVCDDVFLPVWLMTDSEAGVGRGSCSPVLRGWHKHLLLISRAAACCQESEPCWCLFQPSAIRAWLTTEVVGEPAGLSHTKQDREPLLKRAENPSSTYRVLYHKIMAAEMQSWSPSLAFQALTCFKLDVFH